MEYTSAPLKDFAAGIAKEMLAVNQHEIGKLNVQLTAMSDGDEVTDLRVLKEKKIKKGFAINRVLVHLGGYFAEYAEQTRMFDVRGAMVELTGIILLCGGNAKNVSPFLESRSFMRSSAMFSRER